MVSIKECLSLGLVALVAGTSAHPGHDITQEIAERSEFMKRSTPLYAKCGKHLAARGYTERAKQRREALAKEFRQKRGINEKPYLKTRDYTDALNKDHHSNLTGIDFETDPDTLFTDNSSCLLQEETTEGPYYVSGEYVRDNMTETQAGVPILLDMQVIDINTCEPLTEQHVEFWHCNATGVYGGIVAGGNGNSNDATNINNTYLRGIQPTDAEGVVQIASIFPGHYTGRTPHIHILTHGNGQVLENNTFVGGTNSHVGQLFFDQSLITEVEKTAPYSTNTQSLTLNANDGILKAEADTTDPLMEYVLVGDSVEDGLVAWITVGVDSTVNKTVQAAAYLDANGGHANSNAGGPGGPGGPPTGTGRPPTSSASASASA